jgi:hypothetical protein
MDCNLITILPPVVSLQGCPQKGKLVVYGKHTGVEWVFG